VYLRTEFVQEFREASLEENKGDVDIEVANSLEDVTLMKDKVRNFSDLSDEDRENWLQYIIDKPRLLIVILRSDEIETSEITPVLLYLMEQHNAMRIAIKYVPGDVAKRRLVEKFEALGNLIDTIQLLIPPRDLDSAYQA